jgi:hypothetical protein
MCLNSIYRIYPSLLLRALTMLAMGYLDRKAGQADLHAAVA